MADNLMVNVSESFRMENLSEKLQQMYQAKGYSVVATDVNGCLRIRIEKGVGGINNLLGMGEGITATCTLMGNTLSITYSDGDWTGKIVGLVVGWIFCLIPFITAIVGVFRQLDLPKKVSNDIMMLAGKM